MIGALMMTALIAMVFIPITVHARSNSPAKVSALSPLDNPNGQYGVHFLGDVGMTITNLGITGTGFLGATDCGGGVPCPSCEFPTFSNLEYLFGGGYWVGAIVGNDTLVSTGADGWMGVYEMYPDSGPAGAMIIRVSDPASPYYSADAVSDLDYLATWYDTLTDETLTGIDPIDNRPHIPINFEFTQRSYSWIADGINDFIMFECVIANRGIDSLKQVYVGIYMDGDVLHETLTPNGWMDDLTGYLPAEKLAYIMDNDGDPAGGVWDTTSVRGVMGVKFHGSIPKVGGYTYNWWLSNNTTSLDFGPRLAGTPEDPFRSFGAYLGTPTGDKSKYYMMRHPEVDYDQIWTKVDHSAEGWLAPPASSFAADVANGQDTRFLLSFGPFFILPNDSIKFYYSVVMGGALHVNTGDYATYFNADSPQAYYDHLDFSPLMATVNAADSVFHAISGFPTAVDDNAGQALPTAFSLGDNYPNPFNPSTTIDYTLSRQARVELAVYDILGRKVTTLVDAVQPAGRFSATWDGLTADGRPAATGVYFYRLKIDTYSQTKKMLLVK
jgi:hypothetical protein